MSPDGIGIPDTEVGTQTARSARNAGSDDERREPERTNPGLNAENAETRRTQRG